MKIGKLLLAAALCVISVDAPSVALSPRVAAQAQAGKPSGNLARAPQSAAGVAKGTVASQSNASGSAAQSRDKKSK